MDEMMKKRFPFVREASLAAVAVFTLLAVLAGCDTFFSPGDSEEYDTWYYTAYGYEGDDGAATTPSALSIYDGVTNDSEWTLSRDVGAQWRSPTFKRKKGLAHLDIGFHTSILDLHGKRYGRLKLNIIVNDVVVESVSGMGTSGGIGFTLGDPELCSVTYKANWRTSGHVPKDDTVYREGDLVTIKDNEGNLEKIGWTFDGWNTNESGTGQSWQAGDVGVMPDDNVVLYAMWKRVAAP